MKKYLFIFVALTCVFVSCGKKTTTENEKVGISQDLVAEESAIVEEVSSTEPVEEVISSEPIPQDVEKFISLYKELLSFKDKSDFKSLGFGKGSKYQKWLNKADKLSETADISHFLKYNIVPGDLTSLAYVYVSTQGKENEASRVIRANIDEAITQINKSR